MRQASGQTVSPASQDDDELKLMALRGIMQSDPEQALPIIEKMLTGTNSPKVKDRALFVLSQSRSARARDIIAGVAKGNANPDLHDMIRASQYRPAPTPVMPATRAAPPITTDPRPIVADVPARPLPPIVVPTVVVAAPDKLGPLDRTQCSVSRSQPGKARHRCGRGASPKSTSGENGCGREAKKLASYDFLQDFDVFGRTANLQTLPRVP